ncbi:hypothetical protein KUTeg_016602 [Tegillarca granosa]|uniref:Uncharacterized protein n=1 Tax=Tegillarca granosa TaxID=220873 RepID=A0ABQ9ER44_TEGGR|nr:hypothetical protein KUTeg_016602 [Tegillarca granosa]
MNLKNYTNLLICIISHWNFKFQYRRNPDYQYRLSCECVHNTCGDNCERCCPLFNQKPWVSGNEACNCHGHADACVYNATVDAEKRSLNARGEYDGGGDFTTGINCEKCIDGYYRPQGISQTSQSPCRQCRCTVSTGSTGQCIVDDSRVSYGGPDCRQCAFGYYGYPNCIPCPCNAAGSENGQQCDSRRCVCKKNVEGAKCDRCKPGFYNLDKNNPDGCSPCFCFGISDMRGGMDGWTLTTLGSNGFTLFPNMNAEGWLEYNVHPSRNQNLLDPMNDEIIYYWQAPLKYLGSKLSSYGGDLIYTIRYIKDRTAPIQQYYYDVDVIIQGGNITMSSGKNYLREETATNRRVKLLETNWYKMEKNGDRVNLVPVSKREFMEVLFNIDRLMIRASYHILESVSAASTSDVTIPTVEKCACPVGFTGLSCESCQHFTTGVNCDACLPGYYGDPRRGTPNDCRPCACPLISPSNNFAARCRLAPIPGNYDNYECLDCRQGYTGDRCERCDVGYYGNPRVVGGYCRRCNCNGNIDYTVPGSCDSTSGVCLKCLYNTEGERCERCKTACNCDPVGSTSTECDRYSGRCPCKDRFGGRRCDQCQVLNNIYMYLLSY